MRLRGHSRSLLARPGGTLFAMCPRVAPQTMKEIAIHAEVAKTDHDRPVGFGTHAGPIGSLFGAPELPSTLTTANQTTSNGPAFSALALAWASSGLLAIGFLLWLGFSWSGYAKRYAQSGGAWVRGRSELVEITLVKEDAQKLACASDVDLDGLHCAYTANGRRPWSGADDPSRVLRPYSTVKGELLLGAGLWDSPAMPHDLPPTRFTVVCQFSMTGVLKSTALRWAMDGPFDPMKQSIAVGLLRDCVIPP